MPIAEFSKKIGISPGRNNLDLTIHTVTQTDLSRLYLRSFGEQTLNKRNYQVLHDINQRSEHNKAFKLMSTLILNRSLSKYSTQQQQNIENAAIQKSNKLQYGSQHSALLHLYSTFTTDILLVTSSKIYDLSL